MSTPKIKLRVRELPNGTVAVDYEFDFGEKRTLNFTAGTANAEIQRYMKRFYEKRKALREATKPDRSKIPESIDW